MSTPEQRRKTREKVARWRARNATRLEVERALRPDNRGGGRRPTFVVREWVDAAGLPRLVLVVKKGESVDVPAGLVESRQWVPGWPMPRVMADRVRRLRLHQIQAWCGL